MGKRKFLDVPGYTYFNCLYFFEIWMKGSKTFRECNAVITRADLVKARRSWGQGLIAISAAYENEGINKAIQVTSDLLDSIYGFDLAPVLFKPTLSGGEQTFRTTKRGALSYFVGHDSRYPDDTGFGLKGWREVKSQTASAFFDGNVAMWMGWIFCIDKFGEMTKVDKSFGYKKGSDGVLKIVLHHSSIPYCA